MAADGPRSMPADAARRRFTADDVLRMVEAGILDEDEPVELIDGELYARSPQGPRHRALVVRVRGQLERAFGADFHVQDHSPVAAGPDSLPEPDVAVVRGAAVFFDRHPGPADVPLLVEISVTSHATDRSKASLYARSGFPLYWQIDVPGRRVVAYSEPVEGEYHALRLHTEGESVDPGPGPIQVSALLP